MADETQHVETEDNNFEDPQILETETVNASQPTEATNIQQTAGKIEKLQEPQHVNLQAQGEIKQQIFRRLVNRRSCTQACSQASSHSCQQACPVVTTVASSSISDVTVPPATTELVARPASPPPKNGYEIALFLGSDASQLAGVMGRSAQSQPIKDPCHRSKPEPPTLN